MLITQDIPEWEQAAEIFICHSSGSLWNGTK